MDCPTNFGKTLALSTAHPKDSGTDTASANFTFSKTDMSEHFKKSSHLSQLSSTDGKIDGDKRKTFCTGGNCETPGPGNYDVDVKWNTNKCVEFSKYSGREQNKAIQNSLDKKKEDWTIGGKSSVRKSKMLKRKIQDYKGMINQISRKRTKMSFEVQLKNIMKNDLDKKEKEEMKKKQVLYQPPTRKSEQNQFFGSTDSRFPNSVSLNLADSPSPGTYNPSLPKVNKATRFEYEPHFVKKTYKIIPGMGGLVLTSNGPCTEGNLPRKYVSYNHAKNKSAHTDTFGSSEIRFRCTHEEDGPGPGSCIKDLNCIKPQKEKLITSVLSEKDLLRRIRNKMNDSPDIGSYNLENINTIQGDLLRNRDQKNKLFSQARRFQKEISDSKVGPGSYIKISKYTFTQNYTPFNITGERLQKSYKSKAEIHSEMLNGPGLYNLNSYFDWHKKSYNIKYN